MSRWIRSGMCSIATAAAAMSTLTASNRVSAAIDLSLQPSQPAYFVGQIVPIGLYATSDSDQTQLLAALQAVLIWESSELLLTGVSGAGASPLLISTFGPDPSGLNESNPPIDGDGLYQAGALLGQPIGATPGGTLITTFLFTALTPTAGTLIELPTTWQGPGGLASTIVFDGTVPGLDVTGTLSGAMVTILPIPGAPAIAILVGLACGRPRRRRSAN